MPVEMVYQNGELVTAASAVCSPFDVGMTHGAGLFETFRAYGGRVFRLEQHLARLSASAAALSLPAPTDWSEVQNAVPALLRANDLREARMRLTITAGDLRARLTQPDPTPNNPGSDPQARPGFAGTLLLTAAPLQAPDEAAYQRGFTVSLSKYKQASPDPVAGHKTLSYFPRLVALREAQQHGCAESLWFTTGHALAEACMSNVFLVRDEVLCTPPLDTPVLPGITRAAVISLAHDLGIPVSEAPLSINDLLGAQEAFLTNAIMQIMSITRIERHAVGGEKPGPVTLRLRDALRKQIARETA